MGKNLLVVSGHSSDFCTRAGGTIINYARLGYNIKIVSVTRGCRGESQTYWANNPQGSVKECGELRRAEIEEAAGILGAQSVEFLDYRDYPLFLDEEGIEKLADIIEDFRPDIILTHYPEDKLNLDHAVVSQAVTRALCCIVPGRRQQPIPSIVANVYFFEPTVPLTEFNHFEIDTYIDISEAFETKVRAMNCMRSQAMLTELYTRYAVQRAAQANYICKRKIQYAEAFWRFLPLVANEFPLTIAGGGSSY